MEQGKTSQGAAHGRQFRVWKPLVMMLGVVLFSIAANLTQLGLTDALLSQSGVRLAASVGRSVWILHVLFAVVMGGLSGAAVIALYLLRERQRDEAEHRAEHLQRLVEENTAQLSDAKEHLELRVREQTAALAAKVGELERLRSASQRSLTEQQEAYLQLKEEKNKSQQLIQELKQLEVRKDEFISIASHELKTPVTSIRGFVQLLLERRQELSPESGQFLDIISRDTDRLSELIATILDLSRLDLHRLAFVYERTNVVSHLKETVAFLEPRLRESQLTLRLVTGKGAQFAVIDPARVQQVILNLLTNAIRYSPQGGVITVSLTRSAHHLHYKVTDRGPGIAKKDQARLFRRFSHAGSVLTRKAGGTGLGLAIVKELTQGMGGTATLHSSLGKGTSVKVILPLRPVRTESSGPA